MAFHRAIEDLMRDVTAKVIMPRYQSLKHGEIEDKGGDDPVTVADREAEEMLAEGLARIIPGLPVVGEEAAHADPEVLKLLASDCWIVDPLDGTRNFAHGKPPFGVLIAMAAGGVAHTGWIYDCLTGRLCIAKARLSQARKSPPAPPAKPRQSPRSHCCSWNRPSAPR
jgi:fructose-1,6-bisphosphatase/inositol monophosphatase family enzyme